MNIAALRKPLTPDPQAAPVPSQQQVSGAPVTLRNVSRNFGRKQVLKSIDLNIPAGQFLAVVGKSGCGKSTLLRLLAGLDSPSFGKLTVGEGAARASARIMFQEPRLLPWQRIVDNIEIGLPASVQKPERRALARDILAKVGLEDRAGEWPSVLSGGQKQRVALARALVSGPRFLALDEPLGALDALTRIEMQELLERIWQTQKFTAVLVTHDVSEALALADRVILIDEGRIALDITVDLPRPRHRGSADIARLEGQILDRLFAENRSPAADALIQSHTESEPEHR